MSLTIEKIIGLILAMVALVGLLTLLSEGFNPPFEEAISSIEAGDNDPSSCSPEGATESCTCTEYHWDEDEGECRSVVQSGEKECQEDGTWGQCDAECDSYECNLGDQCKYDRDCKENKQCWCDDIRYQSICSSSEPDHCPR